MQITPLRKIRLEKQLTIAEVAAAVNYDVGNLSRLERGTQAASLEIAEKLVKFYEQKITEMQILYPQRYM
ncbi:helix-turn-helix transcriptional regulator [Morganella morganii]